MMKIKLKKKQNPLKKEDEKRITIEDKLKDTEEKF